MGSSLQQQINEDNAKKTKWINDKDFKTIGTKKALSYQE